jgi:CheY-like chemotaxis protein
MPEMGGVEATHLIRQEHIHHPPPAVIALTANVLEANKQQCYDAGMNAVLCKPVQRTRLKETMENCLMEYSSQHK